ncbi:amidase [Sanguibacter sp. 25GB23B1]|uniref:amidase n=1 Tax=unclassified Sanguibacter TaxID=2645534 RepID=UPI0032AFB694
MPDPTPGHPSLHDEPDAPGLPVRAHLAGLLDAVGRYERALMTNDVPELDVLFAPGATTVRSDGGTTLVGHHHIAAFRAQRPPVPQRTLVRVHVRGLAPEHAVVVAESERADGGTGVQTQVWSRTAGSWAVTTAHVSTVPPAPDTSAAAAPSADTPPDGPTDRTIWRVTAAEAAASGTPLPVPQPDATSPLAGLRVAVKDLFAVAGQRVGAGNPAWLAQAPVETTSAAAVEALLVAGATLEGVAQTDELAFSLAGTNTHYGTPPNPAAPGRITGGSTSGPAAAVAAGLADVALGTDTGGSVRVPASYCGLFGLRTTHGAVSRDGLVGLAPSFDTVGVLARTVDVLAAAADALLPAQPEVPASRIVVSPVLMALADPDVRLAVEAALLALSVRTGVPVEVVDTLTGAALEAWFEAFRTVQQAEAWSEHHAFVAAHGDSLEPAVAARFRAGQDITTAQEAAARGVLAEARAALVDLLPPGTVLALPSSSTPALRRDAGAAEIDTARAGTLRLTCVAGTGGLPALSVPTGRVGTLPVGLCLTAGPGQDRSLLALLTGPPAPPATPPAPVHVTEDRS